MPSRNIPAKGINMTQAHNIAALLNEEGCLLQDKTIHLLKSPTGSQTHGWRFHEADVPVTVTKNYETRVDIVLKRVASCGPENPCCVAMKCKPAALHYESWVFYSNIKPANGLLSNHYYFETAEMTRAFPTEYKHKLTPISVVEECPIYERFIEARIVSQSDRSKRAMPETINNALHEVTMDQTGLAHKLRGLNTQMFSLIPVVVTTAKLIITHIDLDKISRSDVKVQPTDLNPETKGWIAINYKIGDMAAKFFQGKKFPNPNERATSIAQDLASRHVRTVFIVQAEHIQSFLELLGKKIWRGVQR
jgi:hypothetical protein